MKIYSIHDTGRKYHILSTIKNGSWDFLAFIQEFDIVKTMEQFPGVYYKVDRLEHATIRSVIDDDFNVQIVIENENICYLQKPYTS